MVQKLALIAIAGLTACAACIGAAAAIGGGQFEDALVDPFGGEHCQTVAGATATSRDMDWDGSDQAGLAIPATANYTPGSDDKLHATGDAQVLAHLRIQDGMIKMDCRGWHDRAKDVVITLPGREFRKFTLAGTGKMNLDHLNQASLKMQIAGVATVKANGKVDDLTIEMAGVSKADFSKVTGARADVKMAGVSEADIAPSQAADIHIAGPSSVNLYSNPKDLNTEIAGPGRLHKFGPNG
ncbi:MAG TPA: DUF2807 domain-containing protein [Rhizomicrobium sp.]|nr:DUF2807 domain-containing protein [Rhizomicrobium sp.]